MTLPAHSRIDPQRSSRRSTTATFDRADSPTAKCPFCRQKSQDVRRRPKMSASTIRSGAPDRFWRRRIPSNDGCFRCARDVSGRLQHIECVECVSVGDAGCGGGAASDGEAGLSRAGTPIEQGREIDVWLSACVNLLFVHWPAGRAGPSAHGRARLSSCERAVAMEVISSLLRSLHRTGSQALLKRQDSGRYRTGWRAVCRIATAECGFSPEQQSRVWREERGAEPIVRDTCFP